MSCDERGEFHTHKGIGLVSDVSDDADLARAARARLAIGHNRYSTTGSLTLENTQPLRVVYRGGPLALAHNGNLVNARELRAGPRGVGLDLPDHARHRDLPAPDGALRRPTTPRTR